MIGDAGALERARKVVGADFSITRIAPGAALEGEPSPNAAYCVDPGLDVGDLPYGQVDARAGDAAFQFVKLAIDLAKAGEISAIVTAPLNKEAMHKGGSYNFV